MLNIILFFAVYGAITIPGILYLNHRLNKKLKRDILEMCK
jgi:hypothetical protein